MRSSDTSLAKVTQALVNRVARASESKLAAMGVVEPLIAGRYLAGGAQAGAGDDILVARASDEVVILSPTYARLGGLPKRDILRVDTSVTASGP